MELERLGVATVTVCTDRFIRLAEIERQALGMPELAMAIASHPFGGLGVQEVQAKADALLEQTVSGLTGR